MIRQIWGSLELSGRLFLLGIVILALAAGGFIEQFASNDRLPKGTIIAFNPDPVDGPRQDCPPGWRLFIREFIDVLNPSRADNKDLPPPPALNLCEKQ